MSWHIVYVYSLPNPFEIRMYINKTNTINYFSFLLRLEVTCIVLLFS